MLEHSKLVVPIGGGRLIWKWILYFLHFPKILITVPENLEVNHAECKRHSRGLACLDTFQWLEYQGNNINP